MSVCVCANECVCVQMSGCVCVVLHACVRAGAPGNTDNEGKGDSCACDVDGL